MALLARLAQQQQLVAAYRARDARLAALLRSVSYPGRGGGAGGGGMPWGAGGFDAVRPGGLGGARSAPPLSMLSRRIGTGRPPRRADRRARDVPAGRRIESTRCGLPVGGQGPQQV